MLHAMLKRKFLCFDLLIQVNGSNKTTTEDVEPMCNNKNITGHQHVHEDIPIELLGAAKPEKQFQVQSLI